MKKLFVAIRQGNLDTVKDLLQKKPELISCVAKQPPKKDDGQSPLQVAIKSGQFAIANYLLDCGADVNFMESPDCCNEWRMPVLQDAIMAAVMNCRWNRPHTLTPNTAENADIAYALLKRMLTAGSDIYQTDSYGNSCLQRAILDARQILPRIYPNTEEIPVISQELRDDLSRIFHMLFDAGMDCNAVDKIRNIPLLECYEKEPVAEFLKLGLK